MAENKRVDLTKIDGMGNGITTNDLQRQAIKDALAEELKDKRVLRDEALALIDEDERKLAELERLAKEKGFESAYGNNDANLSESSPTDIAITITADVDEAVTGLKRLQRELRETTKAVRELESAYKDAEKVFEVTKPIAEKCGVSKKELLAAVVSGLEKEAAMSKRFI